ncbi:unnamed protein product, partial [Mesorhabditis belari]|uniref:Uncharacterized protein n=1 Tax=Mesorhabditis belari TaxID=2138241 RepID=A0AAF3FIJ6_9BILA
MKPLIFLLLSILLVVNAQWGYSNYYIPNANYYSPYAPVQLPSRTVGAWIGPGGFNQPGHTTIPISSSWSTSTSTTYYSGYGGYGGYGGYYGWGK